MELMVSAHMDDFKATGAQSELNWVRETLSRAFGGDVKMSQEEVFIHTGIRHSRIQEKNESDFYFTLDQNEYASAIKPVTLPDLMKLKDEDLLVGLLQNCFMTLLGAAAWLLQTRMEVAVYISALQRHMHSPRAMDLRRLESFDGFKGIQVC